MTSMYCKGSRIRDVVRDSKIRWDIPLKPYLKFDSSVAEADRNSDGLRHNSYYDAQLFDGVFPHVHMAEVGRRCYHGKDTVRERNRSWFRSILPTFDGSPIIEEFWEWVDAIDDYFEEMQPSDELKCKIASYTLVEEADRWWQQLQSERVVIGKSKVSSWPRMKRLLGRRFTSANYLMKVQPLVFNYKLGTEGMLSYHDDFDHTMLDSGAMFITREHLEKTRTSMNENVVERQAVHIAARNGFVSNVFSPSGKESPKQLKDWRPTNSSHRLHSIPVGVQNNVEDGDWPIGVVRHEAYTGKEETSNIMQPRNSEKNNKDGEYSEEKKECNGRTEVVVHDKQEEGAGLIKSLQADKSLPAKCSTKAPSESCNKKQDKISNWGGLYAYGEEVSNHSNDYQSLDSHSMAPKCQGLYSLNVIGSHDPQGEQQSRLTSQTKGRGLTKACHLKDSQDSNVLNRIAFARFFPTLDVLNRSKATSLMKIAAEFGNVEYCQLKTNINVDREVGTNYETIAAIMVLNDESRSSNASSAHKNAWKLGLYYVDFLIDEMLTISFDPGGVSSRANTILYLIHKTDIEDSAASTFDASVQTRLKIENVKGLVLKRRLELVDLSKMTHRDKNLDVAFDITIKAIDIDDVGHILEQGEFLIINVDTCINSWTGTFISSCSFKSVVEKLALNLVFENVMWPCVAIPMSRFVPTCVDAYLTPFIKAYLYGFLSKSTEIGRQSNLYIEYISIRVYLIGIIETCESALCLGLFGVLVDCSIPRIGVAIELLSIRIRSVLNSCMRLRDQITNRNILCWCSWHGNAPDSVVHFVKVISLQSNERICGRFLDFYSTAKFSSLVFDPSGIYNPFKHGMVCKGRPYAILAHFNKRGDGSFDDFITKGSLIVGCIILSVSIHGLVPLPLKLQILLEEDETNSWEKLLNTDVLCGTLSNYLFLKLASDKAFRPNLHIASRLLGAEGSFLELDKAALKLKVSLYHLMGKVNIINDFCELSQDIEWTLLISARFLGSGMKRAEFWDINNKVFAMQGRFHNTVESHQFIKVKLHHFDKHFMTVWMPLLLRGVIWTQCNLQTGTNLNLTRGRVIPWKGWNDENNSNTFIVARRSGVTTSLFLSIVGKNGQFKRTLKLFCKVVNGLDPPTDLDSACEALMWIRTSSLVDELLRRRDGDDAVQFIITVFMLL